MGTETEIIRKRWLLSTEQWVQGLVSAFITGCATVVLAQGGLGVAQTVAPSVHTMDLKQMLAAAVSGGVVGAAAYLKQSPLPKIPEGAAVVVEETKKVTTVTAPEPPTTPP